MVDLDKAGLPAARERLRRLTSQASPAIAYEAAFALAHTYHEQTEQLAVWEAVIPRLTDRVHRARAERERVRILIRLGRRPPTPTTAE
jgi:hypothetical protein